MATSQSIVSASSTAATVLAPDPNRRYLKIRNYTDSGQTIWIAFGKAATCGTAGEEELLPAYTFEYGVTRLIPPNGLNAANETFPQPNCPLEFVSVICGPRGNPTGTAVGSILVISP